MDREGGRGRFPRAGGVRPCQPKQDTANRKLTVPNNRPCSARCPKSGRLVGAEHGRPTPSGACDHAPGNRTPRIASPIEWDKSAPEGPRRVRPTRGGDGRRCILGRRERCRASLRRAAVPNDRACSARCPKSGGLVGADRGCPTPASEARDHAPGNGTPRIASPIEWDKSASEGPRRVRPARGGDGRTCIFGRRERYRAPLRRATVPNDRPCSARCPKSGGLVGGDRPACAPRTEAA
jgi:hypothetical protein